MLLKCSAGNLCCLWQCSEQMQTTFSEWSKSFCSSKVITPSVCRVSASKLAASATGGVMWERHSKCTALELRLGDFTVKIQRIWCHQALLLLTAQQRMRLRPWLSTKLCITLVLMIAATLSTPSSLGDVEKAAFWTHDRRIQTPAC